MKITLLLAGLLLAASPAFAAPKVIVAAADPWPPFVDPASPTEGLTLEIVREALKTQDYEVKLTIVPWARAEAGVKDGTYDILVGVWHTDARTKDFLYGTAYAVNSVKFMKLKGDPFEFKGLESLKGKRVGTIRGYGYGEAFTKSSDFVREDVADLATNAKKLVAKRIDLTLEDEIVAKAILSKEDPASLAQIEFTKEALSNNPLHVAAGLKNPRHKEIIDAYNKGFEIIKGNGTLDKVLKKYGMSR
jgi:polar amino acid transport system substrate-binding protein